MTLRDLLLATAWLLGGCVANPTPHPSNEPDLTEGGDANPNLMPPDGDCAADAGRDACPPPASDDTTDGLMSDAVDGDLPGELGPDAADADAEADDADGESDPSR